MILDREKRANLREFFDHDKTNVFQVFMLAVQTKLRKQPVFADTEWLTIANTLTREAKVDFINELLELLDQEMADQEVEHAE